MEASAATAQAPAKDPHLPPMFRIGDVIAPKAPQDIAGAQVEEGILTDLAVKLAYTAARVNTKWVGQQLHLSMSLAALVMEQACRDGQYDRDIDYSTVPPSPPLSRADSIWLRGLLGQHVK